MHDTLRRSAAPVTHVATIVVDEAVTRLEALSAIAGVTGTTILDEGTPRAAVVLSPSTRATVDIPKFGEAPPLAIDVATEHDPSQARDAALLLAARLRDLGWRVTPAF